MVIFCLNLINFQEINKKISNEIFCKIDLSCRNMCFLYVTYLEKKVLQTASTQICCFT
uniref:Unkown protein n=1 Tax=Riptortus pedestris TaxID=329032 RepID=R4WKQ8_RIPPE|nr:unkown protein [Riptortus pedestris]